MSKLIEFNNWLSEDGVGPVNSEIRVYWVTSGFIWFDV